MDRVRIVSLNAWGGAMFDELGEWLPRCGADVLCLQEVTRTPGLDGWTSFRDAERHLPQRANLCADVGRLLPRHHPTFVASDAGPVRDGDDTVHRQDFGLATFVDERLPVIGLTADFVHRTFVEHEHWPAGDRPRAALGVRLIARPGGRTVTVVNVHGLRDPAGKHDTPARRGQATRLAELVERLHRPGDLVVVCGDLNLLPDSETFDVLAGAGLVDLVGTADTRTSRYAKPSRHASYMLVSDPGAVTSFAAPASPEVSDHRPLILDV
jgi:endonuclease/exonuclease/phosphatase family metal-dependent hydrolase